MTAITAHDLPAIRSYLVEVLGKDFVSQQLEYIDVGALNETELRQATLRSHPLFPDWHQFNKDIDASLNSATLNLRHTTVWLLEFYADVRRLRDVDGFNRVLSDIKNSKKFRGAAFEIHVAAGYAQLGNQVRFLSDVGKAKGIKSYDLEVETPLGNVAIECKSLQNKQEIQERSWEELAEKAVNYCRKYKRAWAIDVQASRHVTHDDVSILARQIEERCAQNNTGWFALSERGIEVNCTLLAPPDFLLTGHIQRKYSEGLPEIRRVEIECEIIGKTQYVKNPIMIGIFPYFEANQFKTIWKAIDPKQLPENGMGIVHIELPYRSGQRFLSIFDEVYDELYEKIARRTGRVNALVLHGRTVSPSLKNGDNVTMEEYAIVPNAAARSALPVSFQVLGAQSQKLATPPYLPVTPQAEKAALYEDARIAELGGLSFRGSEIYEAELPLEGSEGTILVDFLIDRPLADQIGRGLLAFRSPHGDKQLRIWQTFHNKLRFEVIIKGFKRRNIDVDMNFLSINEYHKLAISWSVEGLTVALDGKIIAKKARRCGVFRSQEVSSFRGKVL